MYNPVDPSYAFKIQTYFDNNPMDPDVFAILIPMDSASYALTCFEYRLNMHLFTRTTQEIYTPSQINGSQTPSSQDDMGSEYYNEEYVQTHDESNKPDLLKQSHLTLRLSQTLKNPHNGFQFGVGSSSDVYLVQVANKSEPSRRHFNIKIDDEYNIWLHDYSSYKGTAVGFNGSCQFDRRREDTWILSYPPQNDVKLGMTTIHIGAIEFAIYFPNHHRTQSNKEYLARLEAFCKIQRESAPSFGKLIIDTGSDTTTAAASTQISRISRPLYIPHKPLGSGSCGEVMAVINARTGERLAIKKFTSHGCGIDWTTLQNNKSLRMQNAKYAELVANARREFKAVNDLPSHPNIMRLLECFEYEGRPAHLMPLYEHGDVITFSRDKGAFGKEQCFILLLSVLKALHFLHSKGVVHRDIKGENILVELNPFNVVVADFGASTATKCYSFSGTTPYMAPEVFNLDREEYTAKADIWSAAVTILACYFPEYYYPTNMPEMQARTKVMLTWSKDWVHELTQILREGHLARTGQEGQDALCDMLYRMLEENAAIRYSAEQVLDLGCQLGEFVRTRNGNYEILQATADRVARGQHTSSQDSPLAPRVEAARSRRSTREQSPIIEIRHMPSDQSGSNTTIVHPRNTVTISSPPVPLPMDLSIPSVEQDDRKGYIDAMPTDRRALLRSPQSPDSPRRLRNRSITPRSLDRAGHFQLSKARGVPKSRAGVSKTDQRYPNTRSAAVAKKFIITETNYGETNRQYFAYDSAAHAP